MSESIVPQSPACAVCLEPATGSINITATAASSVPSVFEPRCDVHNHSTRSREAEAKQRVRDAAPLMLTALNAAARQLSFMRSVIMCGEPWTETLTTTYGDVMGQVRAAIAAAEGEAGR